MANENNKNENLVFEEDDDPTDELAILSYEDCTEIESDQQVDAESETSVINFTELEAEVGDADETIDNLKLDLKSRTESISKLQLDIVRLRSRWIGLEKKLEVREEVSRNLTDELKLAHKKQSTSEKLLKKQKAKIDSLKSKLSEAEESLTESTILVEKATKKERDNDARVTELRAQKDAAEKTIVARTKELQDERSIKQTARQQTRSLSLEVDSLRKELAASRTAELELQQYIDRRKTDWDRQASELDKNKGKVRQLSRDLENAKTGVRDGRDVQDDLNVRLASLKTDRDDLLKEIKQIRRGVQNEEAQRAAADSKLLASKTFEISELKGQMTRTESYADELRIQVQDQLLITKELKTRQKLLETLLADASAETRELADCVAKLRSENADLIDDRDKQQKHSEGEIQKIRLDLEKAQETVAHGESLNEELTSDLVNTTKLKSNLESRISSIEEESKTAIVNLNKKVKKVEILNQELESKLIEKDNAISMMLDELSRRGEAIETIGEMENVIHELDDRISEQIDDKTGVERGRITRLLIGKIEGQELRFPLFKDRLTIGRTGQNDIQLEVPYISRRHAVIVTDDNSTRIVDSGSKNGVFVNTNRIKERVLRNGDIVSLGTADFRFEERPKR